jgi:predicted RNA binding protein YcfA (HicA-like mRNA interferase family)
MPKLIRVSGKEAVRAFEHAGFVHVRTTGSHFILKKTGCRYHLSIPVHNNDTLGTGLLKSQIDAAGLSIEEFNKLVG